MVKFFVNGTIAVHTGDEDVLTNAKFRNGLMQLIRVTHPHHFLPEKEEEGVEGAGKKKPKPRIRKTFRILLRRCIAPHILSVVGRSMQEILFTLQQRQENDARIGKINVNKNGSVVIRVNLRNNNKDKGDKGDKDDDKDDKGVKGNKNKAMFQACKDCQVLKKKLARTKKNQTKRRKIYCTSRVPAPLAAVDKDAIAVIIFVRTGATFVTGKCAKKRLQAAYLLVCAAFS